MIDAVFDLETNDPDDLLTLFFLLGHPEVNLKAVTITPGSAQQVGVVRYALNLFGVNVPVGAGNLNHKKPSVSQWHYDAYGAIPPSFDAEPASDVLLRCCDAQTTLIMGAPLTNIGTAIKRTAEGSAFCVGRLFVQGGFAGEGVVPPQLQLDRFKGLTTCPTHNLIHDSKAALAALTYPNIDVRYFVSKNVCHRVYYDAAMHKQFEAL